MLFEIFAQYILQVFAFLRSLSRRFLSNLNNAEAGLNLLITIQRQTLGSHRATDGALPTLNRDSEALRGRRTKRLYKDDHKYIVSTGLSEERENVNIYTFDFRLLQTIARNRKCYIDRGVAPIFEF